MTETEQPQLYLISPPDADAEAFPDRLARVLDAHPVACFRLALASSDEETWLRAADAMRAVAHERDVPIVVADHWGLVERLGLDGVHLTDGARQVRDVRKALGRDRIVGSFCKTSRHDGMTTGEAGADYVAFGPCAPSTLGDGAHAEKELFDWWTEMIEVPVVAEGGLTPELIAALSQSTDFFGIGTEIWSQDVPEDALKSLLAPLHASP